MLVWLLRVKMVQMTAGGQQAGACLHKQLASAALATHQEPYGARLNEQGFRHRRHILLP